MTNKTKSICCISVCGFVIVGCFTLIGALLFLDSESPFKYNTHGYINSTSSCILTQLPNGGPHSGNTLAGTINVSFYGLEDDDNRTLIPQTIIPPGICVDALNPCCSHWIGKLLYMEVVEVSPYNYVVNDFSDGIVQNHGLKLGVAIAFTVAAIFALILCVGIMWLQHGPRGEYTKIVN